MKVLGVGAAMLLAVLVAGCGKNKTTVGITIAGPGASPLTVIVGTSVQFTATASGSSTSTVYWQICKPDSTTSGTVPPTDCTAGQGPIGCTIPTVSAPLTGFGTITLNGRYTAPANTPTPNNFLIVATSCVPGNGTNGVTAFSTFNVIIDSGVRVQVNPTTAAVNLLESYQFTATVTGTSNTAVVWLVNTVPGGNASVGYICPNASAPVCVGANAGSPGEYFAPATSPGAITIAAQSSADSNAQGTATVTLGTGAGPTIGATGGLEPTVTAEGSVQQDVYLTGANFASTSGVIANGTVLPAGNVVFVSSSVLRATIPGSLLTQPGPVQISVQSQGGHQVSGQVTLQVSPVRPSLIASSPQSVSQNNNNTGLLSVALTGGYYVPSRTTATFNGIGCGGGLQVCTTYVDSRHLTVSIADSSLSTPGLYPLLVQNSDAATAGVPSLSGVNLAVTPAPGSASISGSPIANISVGSNPSAVAIDEADGIAAVVNTGSNSVSLVNLATNAVVGVPIAVGHLPTGVAVDDLLPHPLAFVVNETDQTVSTIDLTTQTVIGSALPVSIGPSATSPLPIAIGVNPLTHRGVVAYQSTNQATILDVSSGLPTVVVQVGGGLSGYGTGPKPSVSIDPRMNWALVTPGGAGSTNVVDLGRAATAGDVGRQPQVIANLSVSGTVQGVGVNTETHTALLTDPQSQTLTLFSLLNNSVTPVTFSTSGVLLNQLNLVASAVNPLEDVGIAVTGNGSGATGVVVDLESGVVLQTIGGLGGTPQAVAVDPASNEAVIANGTSGSVSILSLGPAVSSPQIIEATPAVAFGGPSAGNLTLTIMGADFVPGGSKVLLDGTALAAGNVSVVSARKIVATVPAAMLGSARRYLVQVQNPSTAASNLTSLTVVQGIAVGHSPVGVAVDTDRDLAVVTNYNDGTASLVSLAPMSAAYAPESLGLTGVIGNPVTVGTSPEGVAVLPRLGVAVVADNGSNEVTSINLTSTVPVPTAVPLCGSACTSPDGVAINQDTAVAAVTNTNGVTSSTNGSLSLVNVSPTGSASIGSITVDQYPVAVAIDPTLAFAGVATASSSSSVDVINLLNSTIAGRASGGGLQNPTGIVTDPINHVFLLANSLLNDLVILNPTTLIQTAFRVGIEPTSIDYNFQTSTVVTVNASSHTLSLLDYVCPPSIAAPSCTSPQVRQVLGLGGSQTTNLILGPNAAAIDPKLNLGVLVDPDNSRVLLLPLP